jgi:predicted molibdopterin-dependent oxidoreductase YjgC
VNIRGRSDRRLDVHGEVERGALVTIEVDGRPLTAYEGETVAGALMAAGTRVFRTTAREGAPRGLYCGMGVCYDCLVVIDGRPNRRACMTPVSAGLRVQTQHAWGVEPSTNGAR